MKTTSDILLWTCIICFGYFILRNIKHFTLWLIGCLVLRGWWFPKWMEEFKQEHSRQLNKDNNEIDSIVEQIKKAKTSDEVDQLIGKVHQINARN